MRRHGQSSLCGRWRRNDDGATAVEFALVLLPLVLLVFGIVQYGFYFMASQSGSNAARDAARRVSVGDCPDDTVLKGYVSNRLGSASLSDSDLLVSRVYKRPDGAVITDGSQKVGDQVQVTVQFRTLDLNFPFLPVPDDSSGNAIVTKHADARLEDFTAGGACT